MGYLQDLRDAFGQHRLWRELARQEIKIRYRGTALGVIWVMMALATKVAVLSVVFTMVLERSLEEYIPFLAVGLITWSYISALIVTGALTFISAATYLRQQPMSHSIFVLKNVYRELIGLFIMQVLLVPIAFFGRGTELLTVETLAAIAGLTLITLNGVFVGTWLGWLATRYRDIQHLVSSIVQIAFLVSPILWPPPEGMADSWVVLFNPFYHVIETVRAPLLAGTVPLDSLAVSAALVIVNFLICMATYRHCRSRLVLWL